MSNRYSVIGERLWCFETRHFMIYTRAKDSAAAVKRATTYARDYEKLPFDDAVAWNILAVLPGHVQDQAKNGNLTVMKGCE